MTKRDHLEQGAEWGLYGSAWTHCPATKPKPGIHCLVYTKAYMVYTVWVYQSLVYTVCACVICPKNLGDRDILVN